MIRGKSMEEKELLEVVTEDGIPTGVILPRGEIHDKNLLHNEIVVFVINDKNQLLLQKRSAKKKSHPNCWASSCAGHVDVSETLEDAALRELSEELGISVKKEELKILLYKALVLREKRDSTVRTWYYIKTDLDIPDFTIQTEKLSEIRWFSLDEVISNVGNPLFTFKKDGLEALLEMKKVIERG